MAKDILLADGRTISFDDAWSDEMISQYLTTNGLEQAQGEAAETGSGFWQPWTPFRTAGVGMKAGLGAFAQRWNPQEFAGGLLSFLGDQMQGAYVPTYMTAAPAAEYYDEEVIPQDVMSAVSPLQQARTFGGEVLEPMGQEIYREAAAAKAAEMEGLGVAGQLGGVLGEIGTSMATLGADQYFRTRESFLQNQMLEQGVYDDEDLAEGSKSVANAVALGSVALERIGLGAITKRLPPGVKEKVLGTILRRAPSEGLEKAAKTTLYQAAKQTVGSAGGEATTEALQTLLEVSADELDDLLHSEKTFGQALDNIISMDTAKQMAVAGGLGAFGGGVMQGGAQSVSGLMQAMGWDKKSPEVEEAAARELPDLPDLTEEMAARVRAVDSAEQGFVDTVSTIMANPGLVEDVNAEVKRLADMAGISGARAAELFYGAIQGETPPPLEAGEKTAATLGATEVVSMLGDPEKIRQMLPDFAVEVSEEQLAEWRAGDEQIVHQLEAEATRAARMAAAEMGQEAKITPEQARAGVRTMQARAYSSNRSLRDYLSKRDVSFRGEQADPSTDILGTYNVLDENNAIITFFQRGDAATMYHELGHHYRQDLPEPLYREVGKFYGIAEGDNWNVRAEERWARDVERYFATGKAPTPGLRQVFENMRQWMMNIYKSLRGQEIEISPGIKDVFDAMFTPGALGKAELQPLEARWERDARQAERARARRDIRMPFSYEDLLAAEAEMEAEEAALPQDRDPRAVYGDLVDFESAKRKRERRAVAEEMLQGRPQEEIDDLVDRDFAETQFLDTLAKTDVTRTKLTPVTEDHYAIGRELGVPRHRVQQLVRGADPMLGKHGPKPEAARPQRAEKKPTTPIEPRQPARPASEIDKVLSTQLDWHRKQAKAQAEGAYLGDLEQWYGGARRERYEPRPPIDIAITMNNYLGLRDRKPWYAGTKYEMPSRPGHWGPEFEDLGIQPFTPEEIEADPYAAVDRFEAEGQKVLAKARELDRGLAQRRDDDDDVPAMGFGTFQVDMPEAETTTKPPEKPAEPAPKPVPKPTVKVGMSNEDKRLEFLKRNKISNMAEIKILDNDGIIRALNLVDANYPELVKPLRDAWMKSQGLAQVRPGEVPSIPSAEIGRAERAFLDIAKARGFVAGEESGRSLTRKAKDEPRVWTKKQIREDDRLESYKKSIFAKAKLQKISIPHAKRLLKGTAEPANDTERKWLEKAVAPKGKPWLTSRVEAEGAAFLSKPAAKRPVAWTPEQRQEVADLEAQKADVFRISSQLGIVKTRAEDLLKGATPGRVIPLEEVKPGHPSHRYPIREIERYLGPGYQAPATHQPPIPHGDVELKAEAAIEGKDNFEMSDLAGVAPAFGRDKPLRDGKNRRRKSGEKDESGPVRHGDAWAIADDDGNLMLGPDGQVKTFADEMAARRWNRDEMPDYETLKGEVIDGIAKYGAGAIDWYKQFADTIVEFVGVENLDEATTIWGITSAQTKVEPNFMNTLWIMKRARDYKAEFGKLPDDGDTFYNYLKNKPAYLKGEGETKGAKGTIDPTVFAYDPAGETRVPIPQKKLLDRIRFKAEAEARGDLNAAASHQAKIDEFNRPHLSEYEDSEGNKVEEVVGPATHSEFSMLTREKVKFIVDAYQTGRWGNNFKTPTFALNTFYMAVDPDIFFPFTTNDVHVSNIFGIHQSEFASGAYANSNYRAAQYVMAKIAQDLGMSPHSVQAVLWAVSKFEMVPDAIAKGGMVEDTKRHNEPIKAQIQQEVKGNPLGIHPMQPMAQDIPRDAEGKLLTEDVRAGRVNTFSHDKNAIIKLQEPLVKRGGMVFATAPWAGDPTSEGGDRPLSISYLLQLDDKLGKILFDEESKLWPLKLLGIEHKVVPIAGSYEGGVEPGFMIQTPFASRDALEVAMSIMGSALHQNEGVLFRNLDFYGPRTEGSTAAAVVIPPGGMTRQRAYDIFEQHFTEKTPSFSAVGDGLMFLDFTYDSDRSDAENLEAHNAWIQEIERVAQAIGARVARAKSDSYLIGLDPDPKYGQRSYSEVLGGEGRPTSAARILSGSPAVRSKLERGLYEPVANLLRDEQGRGRLRLRKEHHLTGKIPGLAQRREAPLTPEERVEGKMRGRAVAGEGIMGEHESWLDMPGSDEDKAEWVKIQDAYDDVLTKARSHSSLDHIANLAAELDMDIVAAEEFAREITGDAEMSLGDQMALALENFLRLQGQALTSHSQAMHELRLAEARGDDTTELQNRVALAAAQVAATLTPAVRQKSALARGLVQTQFDRFGKTVQRLQAVQRRGLGGAMDDLHAAYAEYAARIGADKEIVELIMSKNIMDPKQAAEMRKIVRELEKPGMQSAIQEYIRGNMLSNVVGTGGKGLIGNAVMLANWLGARPIVGAIDAALSTTTGKERQAFAGEATAAWRSLFLSDKNTVKNVIGMEAGSVMGAALKAANLAFRTGFYADPLSSSRKLEMSQTGAIGGDVMFRGKPIRERFPKVGKALDKYGEIHRKVAFGPLQWGDAFFKTLNQAAATNQQAYRLARKQGLSHYDALNKMGAIAKDIYDKPQDYKEQIAAIRMVRDVNLFVDPPGKVTNAINNLRKQIDDAFVLWPMGTQFLPFTNIPTKVFNQAWKLTPMKGAINLRSMRQAWLDLKAGKMDVVDEELLEDAAKTIIGTTMFLGVMALARSGFITGGGPEDRDARRTKEATGWQPYAFNIGDFFVGFGALEPWATIMGAAADVVEDVIPAADADEAMSKAINLTKENLTNKSFLVGMENLLDTVSNPEKKAKGFIKNLAGNLVPFAALSRQAARTIDPVSRKVEAETRMGGAAGLAVGAAESIGRGMASNIPLASKFLEPYYGVTGEESVPSRGAPENIALRAASQMSPVRVTRANPERVVEAELARLSEDYPDLRGRLPIRTQPKRLDPDASGPARSERMTREEIEIFNKAHQRATKKLQRKIMSPTWDRKSDEKKVEAIKEAFRDEISGKRRNDKRSARYKARKMMQRRLRKETRR